MIGLPVTLTEEYKVMGKVMAARFHKSRLGNDELGNAC